MAIPTYISIRNIIHRHGDWTQEGREIQRRAVALQNEPNEVRRLAGQFREVWRDLEVRKDLDPRAPGESPAAALYAQLELRDRWVVVSERLRATLWDRRAGRIVHQRDGRPLPSNARVEGRLITFRYDRSGLRDDEVLVAWYAAALAMGEKDPIAASDAELARRKSAEVNRKALAIETVARLVAAAEAAGLTVVHRTPYGAKLSSGAVVSMAESGNQPASYWLADALGRPLPEPEWFRRTV